MDARDSAQDAAEDRDDRVGGSGRARAADGDDRELPTDGSNGDEQKRADQQKSAQTILQQEIDLALGELERPTSGLVLSGLSAGLDIGFSALAVAIVLTFTRGVGGDIDVRFMLAGAYSIGFVFVIFGRSELYTEHTTLAALPVIARKAPLRRLFRLWGLVYLFNVVGTAVFALLVATVGPPLGIIDHEPLGEHAREFVSHVWWVLLLSAVLAGWMMGLVSWLVTAARSTISEVFFVVLVTATIGFAGLHHCIAGSVELLTSMFAGGGPSVGDYFYFLGLATAGNTLGGVVFVAIIKFGHASKTRERIHEPQPRAPRRQ